MGEADFEGPAGAVAVEPMKVKRKRIGSMASGTGP